MTRRHGDMLRDGSVEEQALEAVHNDARAHLLSAEEKALRARVPGSGNRRPILPAQGRRIAEDALARMDVRSATSPSRYLAAERRVGLAAARALAVGDLQLALREKRRQVMAYHMWVAARRAERDVRQGQGFVRLLQRPRYRQRLTPDYVEQLDEIMGRFSFVAASQRAIRRRQTLAQFVAEKEAAGEVVDISSKVLDEARRQHYTTLTVEEFRGVIDALRNINHLGRLKRRLLTARESRDRERVVNEVAESIISNTAPPRGRDVVGQQPLGRRALRGGRQLLSLMLSPDTIVRELDGFQDLGPAARHIKGEVDLAYRDRWLPMSHQAEQDLVQIFGAYSRRELQRMHRPVSIEGVPGTWSKAAALSLALNQGNAGNKQSIRLGNRLTDEQVQRVLDGLDKRDWDFVQSVWDYMDSYWQQIEEAHTRRSGRRPAKVQATPVQTRFGLYRGGYYPLRYDPDRSIVAHQHEIKELADATIGGRNLRAATRNGHTIERLENVKRPVMLDLSVIPQHINAVVYDLAMGDAVRYANDVLQSRRVQRAFQDTGRIDDWDTLNVWLLDVAAGEQSAGHVLAKMMRWVRTGFTTSVLAFNVSTAMIQWTGYAQSMAQLGPRYAWVGLKDTMLNLWGPNNAFAAVQEQSNFMRFRSTTWSADIWNATRQMSGRGQFMDVMQRAGFYMIVKMQQVVDTMTWLGGYRRGMDQFGDHAKAVQLADTLVARSQASGIFGDRSAIERGTLNRRWRQSEFARAATVLGSYMIAKANVAYERTRATSFRNPAETLKWTMDMALLFAVETMLLMLIRGRWPDEDDDESAVTAVARETALTFFSTIPFVRDFAAESQGFRGGGPVGALLESFSRSVEQVDQGEIDRAMVRNLNSLGGILFHYPAVATNRIIDAIWRDAEGEDVAWTEFFLGRRPD